MAEGEFWWASYARTVSDSASIVLMDVMQSWFETNNEADRAAAEKAAMGGGSAEGGCDAASDADRADEQMGNGDGFGDGGPLDFAEAAKVCAAGGMEDVQNASQLPKDPLVVRLPSSGALGLLSSALCRAAAAFLCVASKAALGWSGMIQSGQGLDVDAADVTTADAPPPVSSCDRIDPAVVEKETAALCSRIRSGEVLDEVGDGTCEAADDSSGDPTFSCCVTVETLADALADVTQPLRVAGVSAEIPVDPPPCLSIGAVGSVFSLNELQKTAFSILALALGRSMMRDLSETDMEEVSRPGMSAPAASTSGSQLLFYLCGEGGTSKTRVIEAVSFFCRIWGWPRVVLNAAFTGPAASSIRGSTLHSLVQLSGKGRKPPGAPSPQHCAAFRGTPMVIVDEASMLSAEQHAEMERRLRLLMENQADFGGLHVCQGGDFFQMPPIGAPSLFVDSTAAHEAACKD